MTAPNHALTGALIGLAVGSPWLALPLALVSHFICDVIPHYDVPGKSSEECMDSKLFLYVQILLGGVLCFLIVLALAIMQPSHWFLATFCAFTAASPDLLFIPRYIVLKKTGKDIVQSFWFWRFHNNIQWFQHPIGGVVEVAWAVAMIIFISPFVR